MRHADTSQHRTSGPPPQGNRNVSGLTFTAPLFTDPNVLITREEHPAIDDVRSLRNVSIALPRGTMVEERIRNDFPNLRVILTDSERDALAWVSNRRADMTMRSLRGQHKNPSSGAGLGLYLVKRVVELHGGHIHLSPETEPGVSFTVVLPRHQDGTIPCSSET